MYYYLGHIVIYYIITIGQIMAKYDQKKNIYIYIYIMANKLFVTVTITQLDKEE